MPESSPADSPPEYRVSYTERVRTEALRLGRIAAQRGLGKEYVAAVAKIERILRIYPQEGEPLRDLSIKPMQLHILSVGPLTVRYVLDEERRLVIVGVPFQPLRRSGLD